MNKSKMNTGRTKLRKEQAILNSETIIVYNEPPEYVS
jgi:hypothetical protein